MQYSQHVTFRPPPPRPRAQARPRPRALSAAAALAALLPLARASKRTSETCAPAEPKEDGMCYRPLIDEASP